MKTRIGKLPVKITPALGPRLIRYLKHRPDWMGIRRRPLYTWKCGEPAPKNPPMPTSVTLEPRLVTQWLTPTNQEHLGISTRQWDFMLKSTGAMKPAALDTALMKALPARQVALDLKNTPAGFLMGPIPFDNRHTIVVTYQINYHWTSLQPDPNKAKVICLLGIPLHLWLFFTVTRHCGPPTIFKLNRLHRVPIGMDATGGGRPVATLLKEWDIRLREWRAKQFEEYKRLSTSEALAILDAAKK